jgi:hypothetical protein
MREAWDQACRDTRFRLTALRDPTDAGERRVSLNIGSGSAECCETSDAGMGPDTYHRMSQASRRSSGVHVAIR